MLEFLIKIRSNLKMNNTIIYFIMGVLIGGALVLAFNTSPTEKEIDLASKISVLETAIQLMEDKCLALPE